MTVLTTQEASKHLRMNADKLRALAARGEIPCYKVGSHFRFPKEWLDTWMNESKLREASTSSSEVRRSGTDYAEGVASGIDCALETLHLKEPK